jgi:Helix-turn-helix domain
VFPARLILAMADGMSYRQVMSSLRTTAPTISHWKQRFEQAGMGGLHSPEQEFAHWTFRNDYRSSKARCCCDSVGGQFPARVLTGVASRMHFAPCV